MILAPNQQFTDTSINSNDSLSMGSIAMNTKFIQQHVNWVLWYKFQLGWCMYSESWDLRWNFCWYLIFWLSTYVWSDYSDLLTTSAMDSTASQLRVKWNLSNFWTCREGKLVQFKDNLKKEIQYKQKVSVAATCNSKC